MLKKASLRSLFARRCFCSTPSSQHRGIPVSVLFVDRRSYYKQIPGLDCWDEDRNALNWPGGNPAVFHPPCRLWSRYLSHFSKAPGEEKELGLWAIKQVKKYGGVLEHPANSKLFDYLPKPGEIYGGGLTVEVDQFHWGHLARKRTWLFIVGLQEPLEFPFREGSPTHGMESSRTKRGELKILSKTQRSRTPPAFAYWLVDLAKRCHV